MIQFNLLPDVKQQYIRTARLKRTAILASFLVAASSLFIFTMLLLSVYVFQKKNMNDLSASIKTNTEELKSTPDLDKVLTIQNQLKSLPELHGKKPVTSRLFGYLAKLTPAQVSIGKIDVDLVGQTITVTGTADTLGTVNKFVDTIKFTTHKDNNDTSADKPASKTFSEVVLTTFNVNDKGSAYTITFKYDQSIFDSSQNIEITVPSITSSRSETEKPTELFKALPDQNTQ